MSEILSEEIHPPGAADPPAFEILNPTGKASVLLVCDHASPAIPACFNKLGLEDDILERHIAYDIGAAAITRLLSGRLDAPAVLTGVSRLVIDCNRAPGDPQSIPEISDTHMVPGNLGLKGGEVESRAEAFFWPYHHAIANSLAQLWRRGPAPALFSIHSFTPTLGGRDRQWDLGVLWNRDPRLAAPLIAELGSLGTLHVGDNEPYSGREIAYTIDLHGGAAGLPNGAVEIRQDHLETEKEISRWAGLLGDALGKVLAQAALHRVEHY